MNETTQHREAIEQLAEEFAERYRRGERPTVEEYAVAHPELASEIRDLFPTLAMMEELAPSDASSEPEASARGSSIVVKPLDRIGDFRILREIGRGGMGVVYEAEQESLGRRVALKVLPLHSASDPKLLARFRRESRAAGQLHHTNIVPIFEVGEYGDIAWYAMQFIPGQALDEVVRELQRLRSGKSAEPIQPSPLTASLIDASPVHGPDVNTTDAYRPIMPETGCALSDSTPMVQSIRCNDELVELDFRLCCRNVSRIGLQVADALAFAHARGVVHRDIKPSNLLLDTAGIVWVTDFGLAKTQEHALTETGDIVGTVRYMAPERFRGECDARSDVYSLGVTLYELLTLTPAFDNSDRLKLIESIGSREPIKPRAIEPLIPRDVETIVLKAIEKDPRRRYQSAEAMAADLRRYLNDEPIQARRVGVAERAWRSVRRNPVVTGLVAFAVIDILVFLLVLLNQNQRLTSQRDAAQSARDELRGTLYASQMNLVQSAYEADNVARALDILEKQRPKDGEPDLRGWEWHYWRQRCRGEHAETRAIADLPGAQWKGYVGERDQVALSPDGRWLAAVRSPFSAPRGPKGPETDLRVWDSQSGQLKFRTVLGVSTPFGAPLLFSRDASWVMCSQVSRTDGRRGLSAFDVKTGRELFELERKGNTGDFVDPVVSEDGGRIAAIAEIGGSPRRESVHVWDAQNGRKLASHPIPIRPGGDGQSAHSDVVTYSRVAAVSPSGDRLAVSTIYWRFNESEIAHKPYELHFRVIDANSGNEIFTIRRQTQESMDRCAAAYSPDGRWLAILCEGDTGIGVLDAGTGAVRRQLQLEPVDVILSEYWANSILRFSPDNRRLAFVGSFKSSGSVWDLETGRRVRTLRGHAAPIASLTFSGDGQRVITVGRDQCVKSWSLIPIESPDPKVIRAVSRDGSLLASEENNSGKKFIRIRRTATAERISEFANERRPMRSCVFSPDGRQLIAAAYDEKLGQTVLQIFEVATGTVARTIPLETVVEHGMALAISDDGRRLLAAWRVFSDDPRKLGSCRHDVWDLATATRLLKSDGPLHLPGYWAHALSPDGSRLAIAVQSDNEWFARILNVDTGAEMLTIPVGNQIATLAFSPDGRRLAIAAYDQSRTPPVTEIRVVDATSGEAQWHVREVLGYCHGVTLNADSSRMAVFFFNQSSFIGEVKLFDTGSLREVMSMRLRERTIQSLRFSSDWNTLVVLGYETGVHVWNGTPLAE